MLLIGLHLPFKACAPNVCAHVHLRLGRVRRQDIADSNLATIIIFLNFPLTLSQRT